MYTAGGVDPPILERFQGAPESGYHLLHFNWGGEVNLGLASEAQRYLSHVYCDSASGDVRYLAELGDAMMTWAGDARIVARSAQYGRMESARKLVPGILASKWDGR